MTSPLTLVLYGGPGTGKSTTAAAVFAELKMRGRNVELVPEVAKGFTWEKRTIALAHQPYVVSKQMLHLDRLAGQVDAVVTDTSTMLALVYGQELTQAFRAWVVDDYRSRQTINVLLKRDHSVAYEHVGRSQSAADALLADKDILNLLRHYDIPFTSLTIGSANLVKTIADKVESALV